jgi:hypothetical protein
LCWRPVKSQRLLPRVRIHAPVDTRRGYAAWIRGAIQFGSPRRWSDPPDAIVRMNVAEDGMVA